MITEHEKIFVSIVGDVQSPTNEELLKNKEEYLYAQEQIKKRVNAEIEEILNDSMNLG